MQIVQMYKALQLVFAAALTLLAQPATANVLLTFHSFNGSVFLGRYPHTFVTLNGRLEGTGEIIHANYGYSTSAGERVVLGGEFKPEIFTEEEKYIRSSNRHFAVELTDEQYARVMSVITRWRSLPYIFKTRNCIHFVAAIAREVGIKADVPANLTRKPRAWLQYVASLNPRLGAAPAR